MDQPSLKSQLESILFVANKPLRAQDLAKILELPQKDITPVLEALVLERSDSGIVLLENNGWYQFATQPANAILVKNFLNTDLREKLTDATVEVLAIISYRQPISKAEIEAIRGVNSQYSIRHLLMRGMIEKVSNPHDGRGFLYQTTTEFLQHLGLNSLKDLPEFEKLVSGIKLPETPALSNDSASQEITPGTVEVVEEDPQDNGDGEQ